MKKNTIDTFILFIGLLIAFNVELYAQTNTPKHINKVRTVQGTPPSAPTEARLIDYFEQLGIDTPLPRFGWVVNDIDREEKQTAYQIMVATSPDELTGDQGSAWDSGKVLSSQQLGITYTGSSLTKSSQYWWKVRTWDKDNMVSPWSENKSFITGFFQKSDWNIGTQWIRHPQSVSLATDVPVMFRKTFSVNKPVKQAFLYVTGLGQFVASLNGSKVGNHAIDPAWTDYDRSVNYVTFDVTSQIIQGGNALGLMLGNGWLNATDNLGVRPFGVQRMMAQLHIDYNDGSSEDVVSDQSWKASKSPFTYTDVHGVEIYDARLDQAGWKTSTFDDSTWPVAVVSNAPTGILCAQSSPPILSNAVFTGKNISSPTTNNYVFDFGQNMNAQFEIKVSGKAGAKVTLTPGEFLNSNGTVNPGRSNIMTYTLKGDGVETWRQTFSTIGLRYVQVGGVSTNAAQTILPYIQNVNGYFTYTGSNNVGSFTTSDERYNKISVLALNALRSNLTSIHTDGPNLEKLGWQEVVWTTVSSSVYQHDLFNLYTKILKDVREAQRTIGLCSTIAPNYFYTTTSPSSGMYDDAPAWGASIFNAAWHIYQTYGDKKILEDNYTAMTKYLTYLKSKESGGLITYGLGDWMAPGGHSEKNVEGAVYVLDTRVMRDVAAALGKSVDATYYGNEYVRVLTAYNNSYFNSALGSYNPVSQGNLAIPLAFGIVPAGRKKDVEKALIKDIAQPVETTSNGGNDGSVVANHVTTGDIGTTFLWRSLGDADQHDLVQTMIMQPTSPSYMSMINSGETSMSENWNLSNIRSHDHDMYSGIFEWLYRTPGGISSMEPGYSKIQLKPGMPSGLASVNASYNSVHGLIGSSWKVNGKEVTWNVSIPVNTNARICVPTMGSPIDSLTINEGSTTIFNKGFAIGSVQGIVYDSIEVSGKQKYVVWNAGSGNYQFTWKLSPPTVYLDDLILLENQVSSILASAVIDTIPGTYLQSAKDVLTTSLNKAKAIKESNTQFEIDQMTTELTASLNAFKSSVIYSINTLTPGDYSIKKVGTNLFWTNTGQNKTNLTYTEEKPVFQAEIKGSKDQLFHLTLLSNGRYEIFSKSDVSAYINESAKIRRVLGSFDANWGSLNILYNGTAYAVQTAGNSAGNGFWTLISDEVTASGVITVNNETNFVFNFVPNVLNGVNSSTISPIHVFGKDKSIQILKKSFGEVQIYDVKGFLIKQLSSDGDASITLPVGLYIVKVKTSDSVIIEKTLVK